MGNVREIKRRIKSIDNIKQITKAMKMIAAVRIKRVETLIRKSSPYVDKLRQAVGEVLKVIEGESHPLMQVWPVKKISVIVVASDKGLCGSYNHNVLRESLKFVEELEEKNMHFDIIPFGVKAEKFFAKRNFSIYRKFSGWNATYSLAKQIADICIHRFKVREADEIVCLYNKPVSSLVQKVEKIKILPLDRNVLADSEKLASQRGLYYFEPAQREVLNYLLTRYVEGSFFHILLGAKSSELGARLKAMSNATDNAEKYSDELSLKFFRARQEDITREILEVSSGAEALR